MRALAPTRIWMTDDRTWIRVPPPVAPLPHLRPMLPTARPEEVPMTTKPTITEVLPLVRAYYAKPGNEAGGSLHVVLDDGNVSDDDVRFCLQQTREHGDADGVALAEKLLLMSRTQRRKLGRLNRWAPPRLPPASGWSDYEVVEEEDK